MEENKVLLRRVKMGAGIWTVVFVELFLGILAAAGGVFIAIYGQEIIGVAIFFFVFALWMILTFIYAIIRSSKSQKAGPYCLVYHEESEEFELFPIFKPPFRVKKADFAGLQRNFFTDFLVLAYVYQDGKAKKVRLGWSLDVPAALEEIKKIREGKKAG